jgi:hypothetical protein
LLLRVPAPPTILWFRPLLTRGGTVWACTAHRAAAEALIHTASYCRSDRSGISLLALVWLNIVLGLGVEQIGACLFLGF